MPNLADYSLADINKFNLLGDFPQDFKNACTEADLNLSLAFTEANSNGDVISIEDFNLSERLLTATYKFPLSALMANRTISFKAPGNFGLYGYLESMAVSFSKGEKMKEIGAVRLFVSCIQNSIIFMERDFPEFAKKNDLDDAVKEVIAEKIADAKKYYDHAAGVFETIHSEYAAAVNPFAAYTKPGKLKIDSYSNFEISKYTPDKGCPEDFDDVFAEAFDYYHVNESTLTSVDNVDLLEKLILLSDSAETTHKLVHNLSKIHSSVEAGVSLNFLGFLGRFAANPDGKLLSDVVLYIETLRGRLEPAVKSLIEQPAFHSLPHKWRVYAEWEFENLLAYYKEAEEYFRKGDFSAEKVGPVRTAPFASKLKDYFYSASHYDMTKIAKSNNSRVYDAVYKISSELPNDEFWAKPLKERIDAFEKALILSDASCTKRFSIAFQLYRLMSDEGIIKNDGSVNDFVGTLGLAYSKFYYDSLGTLDNMNRLPSYIIELEEYITGIAYILLRLNFEDTHSVFYANYHGMEPKLGNPPDSYIKRLLVYYNELYAGFVRMQNSFMEQYVFNQNYISDEARAEYAAAFGGQPAALAREAEKKMAALPSYSEYAAYTNYGVKPMTSDEIINYNSMTLWSDEQKAGFISDFVAVANYKGQNFTVSDFENYEKYMLIGNKKDSFAVKKAVEKVIKTLPGFNDSRIGVFGTTVRALYDYCDKYHRNLHTNPEYAREAYELMVKMCAYVLFFKLSGFTGSSADKYYSTLEHMLNNAAANIKDVVTAEEPEPAPAPKPEPKPTPKPAKPKTTVAPPKPKTTEKPVRKPEDEKKMRDLSASAAYKMADDASVTDKQRNDYIDNLVSYAADTSNADTSIDLSEKALLIGRKSHYKCDLSIKNLVNRLKYNNCITNDNRPSGTLAGTFGNSLDQCKKAHTELPEIGNQFKMILSLVALVLCVVFIGYIWFVDPESVMWLGARNMKKLFIVAGLGIISGMLSGGFAYAIINLIATGVIFTVGAIVTSVLDFSTLAQDKTILTIAALYFSYFACVFIYSNSPSAIKADKEKRAKMIKELNLDLNANIQYANAMIETLEPMRAKNADAAVLIEYYKTVKKAFESIKI